MIHASKLLSSSSPLSLSKLEAIANDLVFRRKVSETPQDPKDLLVSSLDAPAKAVWITLSEDQQNIIVQDFSDAIDNAIYEFKYSEYTDDDSDDEQHVTSFRGFK